MKKLIVWILTLSLLVGLVPAVHADNGVTVQAGKEEAELLQAQINFGGYLHSAVVLRAQDGTILAPLNWMTYYGGLQCEDNKGVLQYRKPQQEKLDNYAKRWWILPQTQDYLVGWYFDTDMFADFVIRADDCSMQDAMKLIAALNEEVKQWQLDAYFSQKNTDVQRVGTNYMPIHRGKFSKFLPYADDYWVPVSELLALLEISAGVSDDGRILCMKPSQITLFDVLYEHADEIEDLLFDSENVVGSEFMAIAGRYIATLTGELYNIIPVLGKEIDYKEIFTSYLQDNEVYLSTFNAETDSKASYYKQVADAFKGAKTIFDSAAKAHKPVYDLFLEGVTNKEFYTKYFKPAKAAGRAVDIAANAMSYIEAFSNQVEDHRLMLDAVYDYKAKKKWPSYVASQAVAKTYESKAKTAIAATVDTTQKLVVDEINDKIFQKALGGWYYAIEITKVICKDDYDYVISSSKINLVSNTVQYSYEMFEDRIANKQFNSSGMNNIRLCLMMSLIGTRHAYTTYSPGYKTEELKTINEILSKLYQAGNYRKENNIKTCKDRLTQYQKEMPKLQLTKNDPVVIAEMDMLLHTLGNANRKNVGWVVQDTDRDMQEEVSILANTQNGIVEVKIDINQNTATATAGTPMDAVEYMGTEIIPDEQMVFGDVNSHFAALDAHFAKRPGILSTMTCDVNEDGTSDRIYAVRGAARYWDRDTDKKLDFPANTLSLVVAEARDEGVMLRFYCDPNFNSTATSADCSYSEGELLIDGYAYSYQEDVGVPFEKIGLVRLQSIYSYLSGQIKPWEQARVEISYPDDSNRRKMNLLVDGVEFYVHADMVGEDVQIYEIRVEPEGKPVPVIGDITTDHTAKRIIQELSLVSWDGHQSVPAADNLTAVMGPYPLMGGTEDAYECSVLWSLPNGEIYQLTMKLHEESLDTNPYSLNICSLKKPKVAVQELLLRTPEQVSQLLSGYTEASYSDEETIYAEGYIGDAFVQVRFEAFDDTFRAESVEVRFAQDTVTVFPGLKSTASAEDAKDFLQSKMDWKLQDSETKDGKDLYYSTNFLYDDHTQAFWYATMITAYTWTPEDGYSEGAFGGLKLSYAGEKDDSDMSWYWILNGE